MYVCACMMLIWDEFSFSLFFVFWVCLEEYAMLWLFSYEEEDVVGRFRGSWRWIGLTVVENPLK